MTEASLEWNGTNWNSQISAGTIDQAQNIDTTVTARDDGYSGTDAFIYGNAGVGGGQMVIAPKSGTTYDKFSAFYGELWFASYSGYAEYIKIHLYKSAWNTVTDGARIQIYLNPPTPQLKIFNSANIEIGSEVPTSLVLNAWHRLVWLVFKSGDNHFAKAYLYGSTGTLLAETDACQIYTGTPTDTYWNIYVEANSGGTVGPALDTPRLVKVTAG